MRSKKKILQNQEGKGIEALELEVLLDCRELLIQMVKKLGVKKKP